MWMSHLTVFLLGSLTLGSGCKEGQRGRTTAPPSNANLAGQTLRVYNFANYFGKTTLANFEQRTGSKVVVETYGSNEELIQNLDAGGRYDVVFPSSYAVERLIRTGRIKKMERERVPNLIQVPERFRNPPVDPSLRHCVPYTWSLTGLGLHSPRDGRARDPESLAALFAVIPEKAGKGGRGDKGGKVEKARVDKNDKVLMLDDMRATLGMALRFLGYSASTKDPAELAKARDLLLSQAPRVLRYVSDAGPSLSEGQVKLALAWSGDVLSAERKNAEVRFVVPREGTLLYVDYACVPEGAPSPALGFHFLNHLLDPQVAAETTNSQMWATPNSGAQSMLQPEAKWLWGTLDAVKDQGRFEMIRDVGPALPLYTEAWQAVKAKVGQ